MSMGRTGPFLQKRAVLIRRRWLPVPGEVLLEVGDRVSAETVVARAPGRGVLHNVNATRILDILPEEVPGAMLKQPGDTVEAGEPLARTRGLLGMFATQCLAPVSGVVMAVSSHTGRILLEEPAEPLEVRAFLPGIVSAIEPTRGVTVSGWAARAAGVFGVGGERCGPLLPMVGRPESPLDASQIDGRVEGKVLLAGSMITAAALQRAGRHGAAGLVCGGIADTELADWLEEPLVLADTTGIESPLTLVITGGFGRVPMDPDTFALLSGHADELVCLTGHTRVRAGAERPEIIVPLAVEPDAGMPAEIAPPLAVGSRVQLVRAPWFGHRGRIARLPADLDTVESGAHCLVAEVDLDGGGTQIVPRANLEVLQGPEEEGRR